MTIALDSTTGWCLDSDYDDVVSSTAFSPGANTLVVVAVSAFSHRSGAPEPSLSNSGTSLTWTKVEVPGTHAAEATSYLFWAKNTSSQSNITVTFTEANSSSSLASLNVYVFSGVDTTSPLHTSSIATGLTGTNTTYSGSGSVTGNADAWQVYVAKDLGFNGSLSSSDTTEAVDTFQSAMSGYRSYSSSGSSWSINLTRGAGSSTWHLAILELKPAVGGGGGASRAGWGVVR